LPLDVIVDKFTAGKEVFGIGQKNFEEGATAGFTLFTPNGDSVFTKNDILSKSKNSAFLGQELKGKVYGIYNNGKLILND